MEKPIYLIRYAWYHTMSNRLAALRKHLRKLTGREIVYSYPAYVADVDLYQPHILCLHSSCFIYVKLNDETRWLLDAPMPIDVTVFQPESGFATKVVFSPRI